MHVHRPSAVAGRWYPGDKRRLAEEVDLYLSRAATKPTPAPPRAIVAPHAGLMYSGPVAAWAYGILPRQHYSAVVLVGPSHFVSFDGVSLWTGDAWETPFGPVRVDRELGAALRSASNGGIVELEAAHVREHSLEMQLPFVGRLLPGVPIVPLLMGEQTRSTAMRLGDAIASVIAERDRAVPPTASGDLEAAVPPGNVLLVASSDLSHYEDAATAARLDAVIIRHVDDFNADSLMTALERNPRHACGGGPMVAVLHAARQLGASSSQVLRYADSGDVSGDKSSVVGYMAAAIW